MADKWKAAINLVWRAELLPIQIKVPFSDEALLQAETIGIKTSNS